MMKIRRKRLIHCWDTSLINSEIDYTGFILYNYCRTPVNDSKKMLINLSYIYLSNNKFPIVNSNIEPKDIYSKIESIFNINSDNVKHTSLIYSIPHLKIYIVVLKNREVEYSDKYKWYRYIDLYKFNNIMDLYENILSNHLNSHINKKLCAENEIKIYFKLEQLYKYMVGYNSIN
jgi:hypothetical protein